MDLLQAIILGAIQGLGEFLPISSSAHLVVIPKILKWHDQGLAFDVALHMGTLAAVLYYFRKEVISIASSFSKGIIRLSPFEEADSRLGWCVLLGTVPGAVAGFLLEKKAETVFRNPSLVAMAMIVLGVILFFADRRSKSIVSVGEISFLFALLIGLSQAFAVIPGVSRSGVTISTALFLNMKRDDAARFSFLLSIPIIAGAGFLKAGELLRADFSAALLVGIVSAAVFGFLSIKYLIAYVKVRTYLPFVIYRLIFGIAVLSWFYF
ncbi:MAG: undecaprenyl-diphosphate phosphatase [Candidatus Schekmanbacteria bacterium]|nr:MAG: undecaprenyl-diphosphate phosphatase [Candidatus Schekmanbacteria bacterium]